MDIREKVRGEVVSARILAKTVDEATDHILSLFSVVGSNFTCGMQREENKEKCKKQCMWCEGMY